MISSASSHLVPKHHISLSASEREALSWPLVISLLWHPPWCLSCSCNKATQVCLPLVPSLLGFWSQRAKVSCSLSLAQSLWTYGGGLCTHCYAAVQQPCKAGELFYKACHFLSLLLETVLLYLLFSPLSLLWALLGGGQCAGSFPGMLNIDHQSCFPKTLCSILQSKDFLIHIWFPWMFNLIVTQVLIIIYLFTELLTGQIAFMPMPYSFLRLLTCNNFSLFNE